MVLAEVNTPKGVDISRFVTDARRVKGRVDAVVVPDMDNGVMRMSALAGGVLIHQQGVEAVMHVYGRDRNRMALQGDILGAHVLGIQNLIVTCGEAMASSDHREAKAVDDLDELSLLEVIASLQRGKDMAGFDLDGSPELTVGATLPRPGDDLAPVVAEAEKKVAAGASFLVLPPLFDLEAVTSLVDGLKPLAVPVIATVFLLKSVAVARYIAINEPGARLSEAVIKRIRQSSDRELEGLRIAGETVAAMRGLSQGVLIQTLGWEHRLATILDIAGC